MNNSLDYGCATTFLFLLFQCFPVSINHEFNFEKFRDKEQFQCAYMLNDLSHINFIERWEDRSIAQREIFRTV